MGLGRGDAGVPGVRVSAVQRLQAHGAALGRMPVERPLLLGLAPWLLGLGLKVRHHRTFLACLAFALIRLAAFGFHGGPSLPAAASQARVP